MKTFFGTLYFVEALLLFRHVNKQIRVNTICTLQFISSLFLHKNFSIKNEEELSGTAKFLVAKKLLPFTFRAKKLGICKVLFPSRYVSKYNIYVCMDQSIKIIRH